jgi:hypothetical protein
MMRRDKSLFLTGLVIQFLAICSGAFLLFPYIGEGFPFAQSMKRAMYWSAVGPPGLMLEAAPLSVVVLLLIFSLVACGIHWRKVRYLSFIGLLFWGAWWIFWIYVMIGIAED